MLLPLVVGIMLNKVLRSRLSRVQPYFAFAGNVGLFMAVFLNVGTASPLLRHLSLRQIACAILIVLAVNVTNFIVGSAVGRVVGLRRDHQVTCEFSSGMRSNGTALVVGLASFPQHASRDRAGGHLHHLPAPPRRHREVAVGEAPRRR